ncbi:NADH(P)-binding protein [Leptospira ryugenii]|uniref:NADH(P)-binding protein n=1 Tax=Leptospira ryugenii TaxID=1917863 RepID=A0A2P2E4G9_9LEPT|nr:NAD(P)-dependent oxidoreductase [Leptospira ryugenii]GBF51775.1 NADH(P)-binding protein [Leptospira ryugenii]
MKQILLTGVSGVIGSKLCLRLLPKYKIIAIGKQYSNIPSEIRHHQNFKFYERDFENVHSVQDLQISESVDLVLHLAAAVSGSKITYQQFEQINAISTKVLVTWANSLAKKPIFGLMSSVSVYGNPSGKIVPSSDRLGESFYAKSKILAEDAVISSQLRYSIFRIASVYGEGTKSFITKTKALFQKGIRLHLWEEKEKSILHIEDLLAALVFWCHKSLGGETVRPIYVLSEPEPIRIVELYELFQEWKGKRSFLIPVPLFPFLVRLWEKWHTWRRKQNPHLSREFPLAGLLKAVWIYDEESWKDLGIKQQRSLRKANIHSQ